jgi:hypothetical protein
MRTTGGILPSSFKPNQINSDAQAFIDATGISDNTQIQAINGLVIDLKKARIWTKIKALYPMVGGTASTHKYNLKDPRDTNSAFRLSFIGGWTHSATGAKPNGTTAYADTFYISSTVSTSYDNKHLMYYSRDTGASGILIGANGSSFDILVPNYSNGGDDYNALSFAIINSTTPVGSTRAFHLTSRTDSSILNVYNNTTLDSRGQVANTSQPTVSYVLAGRQFVDTSVIQFSSCECAGASMGDGLTTTEVTKYYNAMQKFNTTLSRNI